MRRSQICLKHLGASILEPTAHHQHLPSTANGLVERLHRKLKAAALVEVNPPWSEIMPLSPLNLRSSVKEKMSTAPNELVCLHAPPTQIAKVPIETQVIQLRLLRKTARTTHANTSRQSSGRPAIFEPHSNRIEHFDSRFRAC